MPNSFFPSRTITFYMAKMFLVRSFAVLFAIALVLQALDLLGETDKIFAHPGNGAGQLWTYLGLRFPQIISFLLPFSILLGTLITLATLNQNSEVISMKASGLSAHQILAPLIVASFGVAVLSFAFNDRIVARANATLSLWQKADYGALPKASDSYMDVWVRDGDNLIHAGQVNGRGAATRLGDVTVYRRSGGMLQGIVTASAAVMSGQAWRLTDAVGFDVMSGKRTRLGTIVAAPGIRAEQFTLATVDGDGLSFGKLRRAITDLKAAGRPTQALESILWHKISGPLSAILMPLLGAVAAFGIARSGQLFVRAVIGMGLGFAYFVADNFGLAMGNLGAYPPFLAAWGPFFLFLLIGEAVLIQTEE